MMIKHKRTSKKELEQRKLLGDSKAGYIKMDDLISGWCYIIHARNAHIGIWNAAVKGFVVSIERLGNNYLFVEFHCDTVGPYGTVKPFIEITKTPFGIEDLGGATGFDMAKPRNKAMLNYLNKLSKKIPHSQALKMCVRKLKGDHDWGCSMKYPVDEEGNVNDEA